MRFSVPALLGSFLAIASFGGCSSDLPGPKYIARCDVHDGAAPPRGTLEGAYTATYYFGSQKPVNCTEAKALPAVVALTVIAGTGTQNYTLMPGADPQIEASYAAHPQATLTGPDGQMYEHRLIDGLPGYVNKSTGVTCVAKKIGAINQPSGMDAAELLLEITNCGPLFSPN